MLRVKGYSLWLMPDEEVYNKLNSLISHLSEKYNTQYFEPHVTLIGKILESEDEVTLKTSQLASFIHPYRIELNKTRYLNEYFKCLFLQAKETDEVMRANSEARKIFDRESDLKYMPHLSLMYGDFAPKIKEKIIAGIGKEISVSFDIESIYLFSTNGEPKDWYKIKEFSLKTDF